MIPTVRITTALLLALAAAFAAPARALELSAIAQEGERPPEGSVSQQTYAVHVAIHDQVAAAQHTLQVHNGHDQQVELTCELGLSQAEMVDGFSYWNGSEKIIGEVLEKQAATRVYESLTNVRRDPGILEQTREGFRFRVFPIEPEETKPIEVRTVQMLTTREGFIEYTLPRENLPTTGTLSLEVDIGDDLPIEAIETVGFEGRIEHLGSRRKRVRFEVRDPAIGHDLKVRYRLAKSDYGMRMVTHHGGADGEDGTFMLAISPKGGTVDSEVIGRDVIFVTDISGSMTGTPLEQSKLGLKYAIGQLGGRDRFDVISFDDEPYPLFGGLRPAKGAALEEATNFVSGLQPQGGTNIRGALMRAVELLGPRDGARPRAIIFLTDGQGSTPPEVITAELRKHAHGVRIYPFGAGTGVHQSFLQRLADDNRGIATFVHRMQDIEPEMRRLYDRISMPLMVDLELQFDGIQTYGVYPKRLPDLYRDSEVIVFGRYRSGGKGTVSVRGTLRDRERQLKLDVVLPDRRPEHASIEKLWASRRVTHLLASQHVRGEQPETTQEITRLGIVYNLVTPYTTFLAVPASLQTEAIKAQIRAGKRGFDKKLVDSVKDIRLSQSHIPPGDPVLTVAAPEDSRRVVAHFPFGLVKRMAWDSVRGRWHVRFLVPRDVEDGVYTIRVEIVDSRGSVRFKDIDYTIDGTAPEFDAEVESWVEGSGELQLHVDPFEPVREVYAFIEGEPDTRVDLTLDPEDGRYTAALPTGSAKDASRLRVRVVVRDLAGNRHERVLVIDDGGDAEPGC